MRVLVAGGSGFIGSHLVRELTRGGATVGVFDNDPFHEGVVPDIQSWKLAFRQEHLLPAAKKYRGDVRDKDRLQSVIEEVAPDCIVYLAALPIVGLAETNPEQAGDSMVRGLANALEAARAMSGVKRFVYISSSMVYGHFPTDPVGEETRTEPVNFYGGLKLAGEILTRAYLSGTPVEHVIVRPSGVYGYTDVHGRVVQTFCEAALRRGRIVASNSSDTFIDFTWVDDLVDGLVRTVSQSRAANETFNLTFGGARSLDDLIAIVNEFEPGAEVIRRAVNQSRRPKRGSLDVSKARRLLGYEPKTDIRTGVARYLDFLRVTSPAKVRHQPVAAVS